MRPRRLHGAGYRRVAVATVPDGAQAAVPSVRQVVKAMQAGWRRRQARDAQGKPVRANDARDGAEADMAHDRPADAG